MYIKDGIAYGEDEYIEVISVKPMSDYHLHVTFSNGKSGVVDMRPMLEKGVFQRIKDTAVFNSVQLNGAPTWLNGEVDISPDYLWMHLQEG